MNTPHIWYDPSQNLHFGDDMHPEHPQRIIEIIKRIQYYTDLIWHTMKPIEDDNSRITNGKSKQWKLLKDGDSYQTQYTDKIIRRVIMMLHEACDIIRNKITNCVFILARPPGHHADMKSGPRGFCHINNVWSAVEYLHSYGVKNIAILDWDVHHGDGTETLVRGFKDRIPVKFVSIHAFGPGVYPGTGESSMDENVLNIGLPVGTGESDYLNVFRNQVIPYLGTPDVLIVSAGYDAHEADPMMYMKLKSETYAIMSRSLQNIGCPVMFILEGGYNPEALAESVDATLMCWRSSS